MIEAISYGFLTGVFLSVGFGAVFFALIQDSLDYNYWAGIKIAAGVVVGDFLLIYLATTGTSFIPNIPNFENKARIFGIVLMLIMAMVQIKSKPVTAQNKEFKLNRYFYFIGKGFILNLFNPINFLSWVIVATTLKNLNYNQQHKIVFFIVAVLMIFVCESIVAVFADKIKQKLSDKVLANFKYFTASMFIMVAVKLAWDLI